MNPGLYLQSELTASLWWLTCLKKVLPCSGLTELCRLESKKHYRSALRFNNRELVVIRDVNLMLMVMQKVKYYNMKPENMTRILRVISVAHLIVQCYYSCQKRDKRTDLKPVPGRYLPACLIHQTGTCSVSSPRAARRNVSFFSWGKSLGLGRKHFMLESVFSLTRLRNTPVWLDVWGHSPADSSYLHWLCNILA